MQLPSRPLQPLTARPTCMNILGHPQPGRLQSPGGDTQQGGHRVSSSQFMPALELPTQAGQTWLTVIVAQGLWSLAWSLPSRNLGLDWVSDLVTLALTE